VARLLFGHLPDRLGGAKVALIFASLQVVGLTALWSSSSLIIATIGAAFTGFGYALVYPGLGVEVVVRVPEKNRGTAMGVYTVFLDIAMGSVAHCLAYWLALQAWGLYSSSVPPRHWVRRRLRFGFTPQRIERSAQMAGRIF